MDLQNILQAGKALRKERSERAILQAQTEKREAIEFIAANQDKFEEWLERALVREAARGGRFHAYKFQPRYAEWIGVDYTPWQLHFPLGPVGALLTVWCHQYLVAHPIAGIKVRRDGYDITLSWRS